MNVSKVPPEVVFLPSSPGKNFNVIQVFSSVPISALLQKAKAQRKLALGGTSKGILQGNRTRWCLQRSLLQNAGTSFAFAHTDLAYLATKSDWP